MSTQIDTLKAWCHWKRKEKAASADDLEFAGAIEAVIADRARYLSDREVWKKEAGRLFEERDRLRAELTSGRAMCLSMQERYGQACQNEKRLQAALDEIADAKADWNRTAKFMNIELHKLDAEARGLQAERARYRAALERIRDMSVRPECLCGRPTGTAAIKMCAENALTSTEPRKTDEG